MKKAIKYELWIEGDLFDTFSTYELAEVEGIRSGLNYEIKRETMNIIERIKSRTPRKNKIIGKTATALAVAAVTIAESGLIDSKPQLKYTILTIGGLLGVKAVYHAQKVLK